jgi:hypothetical protein
MSYVSNALTFRIWCYVALNELRKTQVEEEGITVRYITEKLRTLNRSPSVLSAVNQRHCSGMNIQIWLWKHEIIYGTMAANILIHLNGRKTCGRNVYPLLMGCIQLLITKPELKIKVWRQQWMEIYGIRIRTLIVEIQEITNKSTVLQYKVFFTKDGNMWEF